MWPSSPNGDRRSSSRSIEDRPLWDKIKTIARKIYRAEDIEADKQCAPRSSPMEYQGYGHLPICMAKTQYSFSTDPNVGRAHQPMVPSAKCKLSAGAEFVVVVCGDIMTMPGLPKVPAAEVIGLDAKGQIAGLF